MKVRFAPSPTGGLHPGNARIAVFNWLYAKHNNAKLLLRVEDTDVERSSTEHEKSIMEDLEWLGIDWDEGPVRQSERFSIYHEAINELLKSGYLYKCYCTDEELELERKAQLASGRPPKYSGKCKTIKEEKSLPFVLRFDVNKYAQDKGLKELKFFDIVKSKELSCETSLIGDIVLLRNDSSPTYNFAVVVDDAKMGVTHVFRGEDHVSNTFKQMMLFDVLGLKMPEYGHLPILLAKDRTKLSKRSGGIPIHEYRAMGILPDAVFNHLSLLGGMFNNVDEACSREELIKSFDHTTSASSACIYDIDKLYNINSKFISKRSGKDLLEIMLKEKLLFNDDWKTLYSEKDVVSLIDISKEGMKTLHELRDLLNIFMSNGIDAPALKSMDDEQKEFIKILIDDLEQLNDWMDFKQTIKTRTKLTGARLFKTLRLVFTGRTWGPPLDDTMKLINREILRSRVTKIKENV
jgi:glutamyl-tRNA synthetase